MRKHRQPSRKRPLLIEHLEPRQLLAGDTWLVNFQPDTATTPTRYLGDTGQAYGDRGNGLTFGWSSDHTDRAFERNAADDQRLDTLIQVGAGEQWEFSLPAGIYRVTVGVGDPADNEGRHTIDVEGTSFFSAVIDSDTALETTRQVVVVDGRLTIGVGSAPDLATRLNYVQIVGLPSSANHPPSAPKISAPSFHGQIVDAANPVIEAAGFADGDGNLHKSSDWEIWSIGTSAEPVWQSLGLGGAGRVSAQLDDGIFINALAGQTELAANTEYELRVRFRDDAGAVSDYSTRLLQTAASAVVYPLQLEDINTTTEPIWNDLFGSPIELPTVGKVLSSEDNVLAIDLDVVTDSRSPTGEQVANITDGNTNTKYLNHGEANTGLIATLSTPAAIQSIRFTTANDNPGRDPASYILYGTNDPITTTAHGNGRSENWVEISSAALSLSDTRYETSTAIGFANTTAYRSYKVVFPTIKNGFLYNEMQIADVRFYSTINGTGANLLASPSLILPIQDIDGTATSSSPPGAEPQNAIDSVASTKYLNDGEGNSGLIVTPQAGPAAITSFRITTAADNSGSDPASWVLYGTNQPISSTNHSSGTEESWTYIDSGDLNLPTTRLTESDSIAVSNTTAYSSYRITFPTVRQPGSGAMQLGELQFYVGDSESVTPPSLRIEDGATGQQLLEIVGNQSGGSQIIDYAVLADFATVRVVIEAGSEGLTLTPSDLTFIDADGYKHILFLPAVSLTVGERLDLWVTSTGATYYGEPSQVEPDFTMLARQAKLLAGDYDLNGVVDGSDHGAWKATFGSESQLVADGNHNGRIDLADYTVWRNNLGAVQNIAPTPFSITGPSGTATDNTPTVSWEASDNTLSYEVVVAADPEFLNVVEAGTTTGESFQLDTILSNGTYYVSVTAIGTGGTQISALNDGVEFAVSTADLLPNAGFESGFSHWQTSSGSGTASFATTGAAGTLPSNSAYVGSQFAQIEVTTPGASSPPSLATTFYADASQTYLLRWFAESDVNRSSMNIQITSDGPAYSQASFNPSANGWEAYHFAFKATGVTTVTFTFAESAVFGLDELQIFDTNSGPDFTGTRMDPERHYLWRWGQTTGAPGALTNTDNDISVPLPDGRVLWLYNDTYTGTHDPYDNSSFYSGFVRNFFVVQDGDTLTPLTPGQTTISPATSGHWYWPNDALVVGDELKVVLHEVSSGGFGTFEGSVVATYSLPNLSLQSVSSFTPFHINKVLDAGDGYLYIYGGTSGPGDVGVGRVLKANFDNIASWRYWNGSSWVADPNSAVELANLEGAWSITRIGPDNYMASIPGFVGSTFRASFASSPLGPWTASVQIGRPPEPFEAETSFYYMPYLHRRTVQNGVYSIGYSDIGPSGADGDGPFLSNRPGEDQTFYNIQYFLTPNLLDLSPYTVSTYSDFFTDNDPVEWQTYDGDWTAASGVYSVQTPGIASAKAVAIGVVTEDVLVEADVTASGGDAGLLFRGSEYYTGTDNFRGYYAAVKPGTGVILGRMDAGHWTPLAQAPVTIIDGASYKLRVMAEGNTIKIFVDDTTTPVIAAIDSTYTSGSSGLRAFSSTATWDNFTVSDTLLAPPTALSVGSLASLNAAGDDTTSTLDNPGVQSLEKAIGVTTTAQLTEQLNLLLTLSSTDSALAEADFGDAVNALANETSGHDRADFELSLEVFANWN